MTKIKFLAFLFIVGFAFVFTLSSGSKDRNFDTPKANCNDETDWRIVLVFPDESSGYTGRASTYENYLPISDMRNHSQDIGQSLLEVDKYYCVVTVTSPSCSDYSKSYRPTKRNGDTGNLTIKVPQYEPYNIKVEYYEAAGAFPWAISSYIGKRRKYSKTKTYIGVSGVSDSFWLDYAGTYTPKSRNRSGPIYEDEVRDMDRVLDEIEEAL